MKKCPDCGMVIANQAIRCPKCKYTFTSADESAGGGDAPVTIPRQLLLRQQLFQQQLQASPIRLPVLCR